MPELAVFHGEALGRYAFPDPHPFGSHRLPAFWEEFRKRGLDSKVAVEEPASCTRGDLLTFHDVDYVRLVQMASQQGAGYLDAGDTPAFPGVYEAACTAVGTTMRALDLVMEGGVRRAFSPIAGLHHARRTRAGGFCVFNDIGIVIERLRKKYGVHRIGYVDIDAHHGDGVYYEFDGDSDLFIGDIHQDGRTLYPGTGFGDETGTGEAKGTKLNLPMPPGAGEKEFSDSFGKIEGLLERAKPEFVLLQCGADSIAGDPLAMLQFSPKGHGWAASRLRKLADKHSEGRLVAMGGGGYDPRNIAAAWCEVVQALV